MCVEYSGGMVRVLRPKSPGSIRQSWRIRPCGPRATIDARCRTGGIPAMMGGRHGGAVGLPWSLTGTEDREQPMEPTRQGRRIWIVAHRGLTPGGVENSLATIEGAAAAGADLAELDVRFSLDGVPFLLHDPWLGRTTTRHGLLRTIPAAMVANARLRGGAGEQVPRLEDALAAIPDGIGLGLHLKERRGLARVLDLVNANGLNERVWLWLQDDHSARIAHVRAPGMPVTLLDPRPRNPMGRSRYFRRAVAVEARVVCVPWSAITPALTAEAHDRGLLVFASSNRPTAVPRAVMAGLDGVITDDPGGVRAVLEDRGHVSG